MSAQTRSEIVGLLDAHGLHPSHHLGQHFLADPNVIDKIVTLANVGPGDQVVEIGAGTGTLTLALAATGARVLAYEIDQTLAPVLDDVLAGSGVDLRLEDVSAVDLGTVLAPPPWHLVANLPFNIGTPLLIEVLRRVEAVTKIVAMVQREVADRIVAAPGSRTYGLPTVVVGIHGQARMEFAVPSQVFYPAPTVDCAVLWIERKRAPGSASLAIEIARAAFGQRRKMLRKSLSAILPDPTASLAASGISETARPEQLSPEDFVRLAESIR